MYTGGQTPIFILKEGSTRTRGRSAQENNIAAAKAVSDAVRSTLSPKGMDKMLVDSMGDVVITNDGATILKETRANHRTPCRLVPPDREVVHLRVYQHPRPPRSRRMGPYHDTLPGKHLLAIEDLATGQVALDWRAIPWPHATQVDHFLNRQGGVGFYVDPKVRHFHVSNPYR